MKHKKKKVTFICQITENALKVIKCLIADSAGREFVGLETEAIPPDIDDKNLVERLSQIFKRLQYNGNPVIISLPRNKVTSRYLKVPTQIPQEIEKIVTLQASKYLPYPADELICGYQIISTDKEGFADINLTIVHKDVIERYTRIFKELKTAKLSIVLSSYGLVNFYNYIQPQESETAMLVDINASEVELAITSNKKLLFSRYFRIDRTQANWEDLFISEINKTRDVYLKEVSKEAPRKIMVMGAGKLYQESSQAFKKQTELPVETLSYGQVNFSEGLLDAILTSDNSFTSIIGLGLKETEEPLSLLPQTIKEEARRFTQRKEQMRLIALISAIILVLGLSIAKHLNNKALYLKQLKIELNKIAKEAKPLEEIEKRYKFMDSHLQKKPSNLEVLYELHRIMPASISLINFTYDEASQIILRGQAPELNSVFNFVSQLEKSTAFKAFNIKVRYATKRKSQAGEVIDFEIACSKK